MGITHCPICQIEQIQGVSQCTECGSNLEAFQLLDNIAKQRNTLRKFTAILAIVLVVTIAGWAVTSTGLTNSEQNELATSEKERKELDKDRQIEQLNKKVEDQKEKISKLNTIIEDIQKSIVINQSTLSVDGEIDGHTYHIVREGESLWSISEKYHGHGFKHGDIADHNQMSDPHLVQVGDTVIIKH